MRVSVIVPTLNEEYTIGKVVKKFKKHPKVSEVIVVDGRSVDKTREIAKRSGAKVKIQKGKGKGLAVINALRTIKSDYYVFVDGDDTYPIESLTSLLNPVIKGKADMSVGTRLNKNSERGSLSILHRAGNYIISKTLSLCFGKKLKDVLSGYRVLNKEIAHNLDLNSQGFEIETELTIKSLMSNYRISEVPINYRKRHEKSKSKLGSFGDGYLIFYTIISMFRDHRPMFFFSLLSIFFGIIGLVLGVLVVQEWLTTGLITRLPTAVLSALMIFLSVQFFSLGIILDFIKRILGGKEMVRKN